MKLTEEQIWKCNQTEDGSVHISLDSQNVIDFARSIEQEIGFAKAELWIKRINDSVEAEREACAKVADGYIGADPIAAAIRARGTT
tara:strand:- start:1025 stop:1282 length:258 start_codon:yes stop_codon:yes gene_type:complete